MSNKRYTDQQIQSFIKRTNEELAMQDPLPILQDLGIEFKELGNDSYRMNIRGEKTASAYISLKNASWRYKDFGTDKGGNIVNVVMDATQKDYKSARAYALQTLNVRDYLQEALNSKKESYELSQADRERIKAQKEANMSRESSHPISRVTSVYDVSTNQKAIDYLAGRGIVKIPPQLKIINGEYETKSGEIKRVYGVGVLTRDDKAADIHFLEKIGDLKSLSLGQSDISFFPNPNSAKVAVFESKLDYAAAYQQIPLDGVNIIIANSVSNALKVVELLKENSFDTPMIFNQNDLAGYKFAAQIMQEAGLKEVKSIRYDIMSEYKQDINDLLLKGEKIGEKIADRIETRDQEFFSNIATSLEAIQKAQNSPKIEPLKKEDLQMAERAYQSSREKERGGYER